MSLRPLFIGITGTIGAGKDTAAHFFVSEKKLTHISLSDMLREETARRKLPQTRENWYAVGQDLRKQEGSDVLAKRAYDKIQQGAMQQVLVTSFRHPDEVAVFQNADVLFVLVLIDAPIELRYERITKRGNDADQISFEIFKRQEEKELHGDGIELQMQAVYDQADYTVMNDQGVEKLYAQLEDIFQKINKLSV